MKLGGFVALAVLASTVGLTGSYVAGLGDIGDNGDAASTDALAKGALLVPLRRTADDREAAPMTVANAAVIDASLLSPYPMAPNAAPARQAPPSDPEPFQTAAIRSNQTMTQVSAPPAAAPSAPTIAEVRKALVEPRLEDGNLTVAQIGRIKASLHLTPDQERYWGAVENELREIARQLAAQKASGKKPKIALSAVDAQRLYWAAGPLIMSLREDQKQEVRRLARAMGLEQVASLI